MNASKNKVSQRDLTLLKSKLSGILTTSADDIEQLARDAPTECCAIAKVLRNFAKGMNGSRQWLSACMASLPPEKWVYNGTYTSVQRADGASLKYCTPGPEMLDAAAGAAQFRAREALCRSLVESVSSKGLISMVRWGDLRIADRKRHPVLLDVAIADSISVLEYLFDYSYTERECRWRAGVCIDPSVPTPPDAMRELADKAQSEIIDSLLGSAHAAGGSDDLTVRLLSNIAANRSLLESAQQAVHASQAQDFAGELLSALNSQGINEVPEVESDADILEHLRDWFRPKTGVLRSLARFDRRHDAATDAGLPCTLQLAEYVQTQYISLRGGTMAKQVAQLQFGGPCNKLIFALVVAACAYGGITVSNELHGDKSQKLPAYPARGKRTEQVSTHAIDFFMSVFGHIVFSNAGWALDASALSAYSAALAHKRGRKQELVFLLFKRQSASTLLAMHNVLQRLLDRSLGAQAVEPSSP